jgi:hypothetical protein
MGHERRKQEKNVLFQNIAAIFYDLVTQKSDFNSGSMRYGELVLFRKMPVPKAEVLENGA